MSSGFVTWAENSSSHSHLAVRFSRNSLLLARIHTLSTIEKAHRQEPVLLNLLSRDGCFASALAHDLVRDCEQIARLYLLRFVGQRGYSPVAFIEFLG
jgi:hypothetical protein